MNKSRIFLLTFVTLFALACNALASSPATPEPLPPTEKPEVEPPTATPQPEVTPTAEIEMPTSDPSAPVNFTDANNLFTFEIPGNWNYSNSFNEEDGFYVDRFESPDQTGFIENITGFSDVPLTGKSNGKIALYFIHKYYSNTGKEGDIRISGDQIQADGSERLTWTSKGGGYSGMSFFEIRGAERTTFLMFTLWWSDATPQDVIDTLDRAITSYRVP